jgi:hypothetical protein
MKSSSPGTPSGGDASVAAVHRDAGHLRCGQDLHPETLRLLAQPLGELVPCHPLRKPGKVVQQLGDPCLAADACTLDDEGVDAFAGGIERRRQAGGTASDDDEVVEGTGRLGRDPELVRHVGVGELDEGRAVAE